MKAIVLPNPDVKRDQCVKECVGCKKMFSSMEKSLTHDGDVIGDVCVAYINPKGKWSHYFKEEEIVKKSGKEVKVTYHNNPCNLASHISHSPKVDVVKGRSGWKKGKKW